MYVHQGVGARPPTGNRTMVSATAGHHSATLGITIGSAVSFYAEVSGYYRGITNSNHAWDSNPALAWILK